MDPPNKGPKLEEIETRHKIIECLLKTGSFDFFKFKAKSRGVETTILGDKIILSGRDTASLNICSKKVKDSLGKVKCKSININELQLQLLTKEDVVVFIDNQLGMKEKTITWEIVVVHDQSKLNVYTMDKEKTAADISSNIMACITEEKVSVEESKNEWIQNMLKNESSKLVTGRTKEGFIVIYSTVDVHNKYFTGKKTKSPDKKTGTATRMSSVPCQNPITNNVGRQPSTEKDKAVESTDQPDLSVTGLKNLRKDGVHITFDEQTYQVECEGTQAQVATARQVQQAKYMTEVPLGMVQQSTGIRNRKIASPDDYGSAGPSVSQSSVSDHTVKDGLCFTTKEGIRIYVYCAGIRHLEVDVFVNAANKDLQHGGGIAYHISRAAGYDFDKECDDYVRDHGPLEVGSCCLTTAGKLPYHSIIHAVGPMWHSYPLDQKQKFLDDLKMTILSTLLKTDRHHYESIAIPSISSGLFGVPKDLYAQQYQKAVTEFSHKFHRGTTIKEIHFVDIDKGMCSLIQKTFRSEFGTGIKM